MEKITKISDAMLKGLEVTKENGISQGQYGLFIVEDGKIIEACSLGIAYIGAFGLPKIGDTTKKCYAKLQEVFDTNKQNTCLSKKIGNNKSVEGIIMDYNDIEELPTEKIAEMLKECEL
jgi:hypothetical protein